MFFSLSCYKKTSKTHLIYFVLFQGMTVSIEKTLPVVVLKNFIFSFLESDKSNILLGLIIADNPELS